MSEAQHVQLQIDTCFGELVKLYKYSDDLKLENLKTLKSNSEQVKHKGVKILCKNKWIHMRK